MASTGATSPVGFVLVTLTTDDVPIVVNLSEAFRLVQPIGGRTVGKDGVPTGALTYPLVNSVSPPPYSATMLLSMPSD